MNTQRDHVLEAGQAGAELGAKFRPDAVRARVRPSLGRHRRQSRIERIPEPARSLVWVTRHVDQQVVPGYWNQALTTDAVEMQAWTDDRASRIDAPCCSCSGRQATSGERLNRFPGIQIEDWDGDGHRVHLVDPGRFTRLRAFIERCNRPSNGEGGSADLPLSVRHGVTAHADGDTVTVPECCDHDDYQSVFSGRFARRTSRRYQRRGLTPAARAIVDYAESRGISGATVLEIGGGVGHLQVELLRRGASHVTNLEISQNYEAEAARMLGEAGMTDRVTRRFLDIAAEPDAVVPADVVILHRVVCCYPDYATLLSVAAGHARKALAYSHPPVNILNRVQFGTENVYRWVTRNDFRTFIHPPEGMVRAAEAGGLALTYRRHARDWDVVGLAR